MFERKKYCLGSEDLFGPIGEELKRAAPGDARTETPDKEVYGPLWEGMKRALRDARTETPDQAEDEGADSMELGEPARNAINDVAQFGSAFESLKRTDGEEESEVNPLAKVNALITQSRALIEKLKAGSPDGCVECYERLEVPEDERGDVLFDDRWTEGIDDEEEDSEDERPVRMELGEPRVTTATAEMKGPEQFGAAFESPKGTKITGKEGKAESEENGDSAEAQTTKAKGGRDQREYNRNYHAAHREERNADSHAWYNEHREEINARRRERRKAEKVKAARKRSNAKWNADNSGYRKIYGAAHNLFYKIIVPVSEVAERVHILQKLAWNYRLASAEVFRNAVDKDWLCPDIREAVRRGEVPGSELPLPPAVRRALFDRFGYKEGDGETEAPRKETKPASAPKPTPTDPKTAPSPASSPSAAPKRTPTDPKTPPSPDLSATDPKTAPKAAPLDPTPDPTVNPMPDPTVNPMPPKNAERPETPKAARSVEQILLPCEKKRPDVRGEQGGLPKKSRDVLELPCIDDAPSVHEAMDKIRLQFEDFTNLYGTLSASKMLRILAGCYEKRLA